MSDVRKDKGAETIEPVDGGGVANKRDCHEVGAIRVLNGAVGAEFVVQSTGYEDGVSGDGAGDDVRLDGANVSGDGWGSIVGVNVDGANNAVEGFVRFLKGFENTGSIVGHVGNVLEGSGFHGAKEGDIASEDDVGGVDFEIGRGCRAIAGREDSAIDGGKEVASVHNLTMCLGCCEK